MEIIYEEAQPSNAKKVIEYLNKVAGETDNLTYGLNECKLNEIQEMEFIKQMSNDSNSVMIIAKDGDKIIGIGSLTGNINLRLSHRASLGISVLKEYWNHGIGTDMMTILVGYAVDNKIEVVDLEVVCSNVNAIALYEKFGFKVIGTYEKFMKIGDRYLDAYLMNLYL